MARISCFITPHGFGHATRSIAILEALRKLNPNLKIQIVSSVPPSLFHQTLKNFDYYSAQVDVGLLQSSALQADLPATIEKLEKFIPFNDVLLEQLAEACISSSAILCDIAPLGIEIAKRCNIPSILVENFTWDWIYDHFVDNHNEIKAKRDFLHTLFQTADYRIQAEPLCLTAPRALICGPIFRCLKKSDEEIRSKLGCEKKKLVLVTMGGIKQQLPDIDHLEKIGNELNLTFVFTGQAKKGKLADNILQLPQDSSIYHPDLINTADVVVCKTGYSTVAECYQAGVRVISVGRTDFAESAILQQYMEEKLSAIKMSPETYLSGNWSSYLNSIFQQPKPKAAKENGADKAAAFIHSILQKDPQLA